MTRAVIGADALNAKLISLAKNTSKKAARAGISAGLRVVAKAIRQAINASDAPADVKRQARKTIGSRFGKRKGGPGRGRIEARAGFAVGKKRQPPTARRSRGVGLGVQDVHWFVLGTQERATKSGHATGKIDAMLSEAVRTAVGMSGDTALSAARAAVARVIERDARRKR